MELKVSEIQASGILLIEDNGGDAFLVQKLLKDTSQDFRMPAVQVKHVSTLLAALSALAEESFEAILLDLSLPDSKGIDSVRRVAAAAPLTPIVVLTGLDDKASSLEALHAGAQDYLYKSELNSHHIARSVVFAVERKKTELARLKEQLKDQETKPANVSRVQSGGILLNLLNQTLVVAENGGHQTVSLPPREFKLLLYLLKNEGKTVAREEILTHVWSEDDTKPNPRCIDTLVSSLKKKAKSVEQRIESIYGEGYRFSKSS